MPAKKREDRSREIMRAMENTMKSKMHDVSFDEMVKEEISRIQKDFGATIKGKTVIITEEPETVKKFHMLLCDLNDLGEVLPYDEIDNRMLQTYIVVLSKDGSIQISIIIYKNKVIVRGTEVVVPKGLIDDEILFDWEDIQGTLNDAAESSVDISQESGEESSAFCFRIKEDEMNKIGGYINRVKEWYDIMEPIFSKMMFYIENIDVETLEKQVMDGTAIKKIESFIGGKFD
jgi:hypothetical protein